MGAGARTEFLKATGVNLGDVDISLLVGADAVHPPQRARKIADRSPSIDEAPVEIVLEQLVRQAIEGYHHPVFADHHEVKARRAHVDSPLGEVLAVLVEDLDAVVVAIVDEHAPRLHVDGNTMYVVHIAGPRFLARIARLAEVEQELATRIELRDACTVISIGHVEG